MTFLFLSLDTVSLMSGLYWDTSAQHVCLHTAVLRLFMELSSRPGEAAAVEAHLTPSAPPERWNSANVISSVMRCFHCCWAFLSLCWHAPFTGGSVGGQDEKCQCCAIMCGRMRARSHLITTRTSWIAIDGLYLGRGVTFVDAHKINPPVALHENLVT